MEQAQTAVRNQLGSFCRTINVKEMEAQRSILWIQKYHLQKSTSIPKAARTKENKNLKMLVK